MTRVKGDHSSCVYRIRSISCPDRMYIGGTKDFNNRKGAHIRSLRQFNHRSIKLQEHYNEFGEADLVFEVIERCPEDELYLREQYWMNELDPYFNTFLTAGRKDFISCKFNDVQTDGDFSLVRNPTQILAYANNEIVPEIIIDIELLSDYI